MMKKTDICVTIDGNGKFRRAELVDKKDSQVLIPCTEDSANRSGKAVYPHPLHEELSYLVLDEVKRGAYLAQLSEWCERHPKVKAIYDYAMSRSVIDDFHNSNIEFDAKTFIRFRVESGLDDLKSNIWEDESVIKTWQATCDDLQEKDKTLCYVTGQTNVSTEKHPKGINASAYGAKLISCNDETNYTYKGRFSESGQANSISEEASHKAHAMLTHLIALQGYKCDTQAIIAWAIDDGGKQPNLFDDSLGIYSTATETERDKLIDAQAEIATDYSRKLRNALAGMGKDIATLSNQARRVAVMAFDAATTGRMGITFYQDLPRNEYIERVINWHESCNWWFRYKGSDYVSAPSADRIIAAVYGEPKGENYNKIKKQARERLLHHIVCGQPFDRGWVSAAVTRVSQPFSYDKSDGGWDRWRWENALSVTCAIARKYYNRKKEDFALELDRTCSDRDYLFGRLLALADKIESHARFIQKAVSDEKRPTNAVRYMSAFASKPLRTWKLIYDQLNPYIQRLNGAEWYQQQIDEIMSLFNAEDLNDRPLDGKYLLGYSLQRRALRSKNEEDTFNEPNQED
jgi:CRISPR-associated protein Csd1